MRSVRNNVIYWWKKIVIKSYVKQELKLKI